MKTFGGIDSIYADYGRAGVLLQSLPYDGTSTWGKGADKGFDVFLEATENMELYDIETDSEAFKKGICIMPVPAMMPAPGDMYRQVYTLTKDLLDTGKFLTFFGGEHSVSIGIIEAFREKYDDLTVLQLDAHADLRKEYLGSEYNHACALHKASETTNLIQAGIRSMDISEKEYLKRENCYFADDIMSGKLSLTDSFDKMTDNVYLTIDLDVFDPSVMPATGTPEPGGLDWYTVITYLRNLFRRKNVVGFDIVEFAPMEGFSAPGFLVAKLYYKLLSYKYSYEK